MLSNKYVQAFGLVCRGLSEMIVAPTNVPAAIEDIVTALTSLGLTTPTAAISHLHVAQRNLGEKFGPPPA